MLSIAQAESFAESLLRAKGLEPSKATVVAHLLVQTEAMGRHTHGLAMLPLYLVEMEKGHASGGADAGMATHGEPLVLKQGPITAVWDGRYLPGLWLVQQALAWLMPRAREFGLASVAIRRSHHIGCLAALLRPAAEQGFVALLANSDPAGQRVAPYGGKQALFTPNPFAFAHPGEPRPVLVDSCASITTTSMTRAKVAAGEHFEHPWLLDHQGQPTTDPSVLEGPEPRGSLQLTGGQDHGHKGFGWSLMTEALSQGLSGHGRADAPKRWGGNVYLQLIAPSHFAGDEAFATQTGYLAQQCRANPPIDPARPVRLPGDQANALLARAQREGLAVATSTIRALSDWSARLHVALPKAWA